MATDARLPDDPGRLRPFPAALFAATIALVSALSSAEQVGAMPSWEIPRDGMASPIHQGPGVTALRRLSDYAPTLSRTPGDTRVYILDSGKPGGTLLVVGGTHADEPAGIVAAIAIVETARPVAGRLIVVPYANNSASGYGYPGFPGSGSLELSASGGSLHRGRRVVKTGQRLTKPADQGTPDPVLYYPPGSASVLDGYESRNLDRAYPGAPDGTLTERVAFGLMELLRTERVDIAFDLHEAPADSQLSMTIIAHERALGLAALAVLDLEDAGVDLRLEASPAAYPGLSHREWGDRSGALAFIIETPKPAMGSCGPMQAAGCDGSLPRRVSIHLSAVEAIVKRYNEGLTRGRTIEYTCKLATSSQP